MRVSGQNDGDFYSKTLHCECWRIEVNDYWKSDPGDDCWPWQGECQRGCLEERGRGGLPKYKSDPVSADEALYPYLFKEIMKCHDIQKGTEADPSKSIH